MLQTPVSAKEILKKVVKENKVRISRQHNWRLKRVVKAGLDYAITLPALILLLPLILLIVILIKLESEGPIFFRQRVLGLNGREFDAYRFRTMFINGDDLLIQNRQEWVALLRNGRSNNDPRMTKVGRFLQRTGLNELPRLFNILSRDMTIVGPYMVTRKEILRYGRRQIDMITSVRPGLIGLWQLSQQTDDNNDRLSLEKEYIQNWSLRLDLSIIFNTFTLMLKTPVPVNS